MSFNAANSPERDSCWDLHFRGKPGEGRGSSTIGTQSSAFFNATIRKDSVAYSSLTAILTAHPNKLSRRLWATPMVLNRAHSLDRLCFELSALRDTVGHFLLTGFHETSTLDRLFSILSLSDALSVLVCPDLACSVLGRLIPLSMSSSSLAL